MSEFRWVRARYSEPVYEVWSEGQLLGYIERRPSYCDRGHFKVSVDVPDLDRQDGFPRYFMRLSTAVQELNDFLNWRLNKVRAPAEVDQIVFLAAKIPLEDVT